MSELLPETMSTPSPLSNTSEQLDLSGSWRLALDPLDQGQSQHWFEKTFVQELRLPGILSAQGFGDKASMRTPWTGDVQPSADKQSVWLTDPQYKAYQTEDNFKIPFWPQPDRHYLGVAWYQRDFVLPESWTEKHLTLHLERVHWSSKLWLDGQELGSCDRLGTPHRYVLGGRLSPGTHRLTLRIDNRVHVNVGPNSHSISDHTQGNWNGVVGALRLEARPALHIVSTHGTSLASRRELSVRLKLSSAKRGKLSALLRYQGPEKNSEKLVWRCERTTESSDLELCFQLGDGFRAWDEFHPHLYSLELQLSSEDGMHSHREMLGLREIGTRGTRFVLNGNPVFLRGTLECCIFPKEGRPPTDAEAWKRILRICRAHGLNHLRFHSWCPPEAAFQAADELGFYLQIEASSWANQGAEIGSSWPLDAWVEQEAEAILETYGNHPSFLLFCYGNEPAGPQHAEWLAAFVARLKARDPRRLYTTGSGWTMMPGSDYHSHSDPRLHQWGAGLSSRLNALPPGTDFDYADWVEKHPDAPTISHEIGQWCAYPDFREIESLATAHQKPRNFEIFRELAKRHGLVERAADYLRASGRIQVYCYKNEIEAALRTPGFGGFQLLDLHDFPGQGTALVGVLNSCWESKGYLQPEEFRAFCGPVVPLLRLPRLVWQAGDLLEARVQVSHFGEKDLLEPLSWELADAHSQVLASGSLPHKTPLTRGALHELGKLRLELPELGKAAKLSLRLHSKEAGACNSWDLWLYPPLAQEPAADHVLISEKLDEQTRQHLAAGKTVLWLPRPASLKQDPVRGDIEIGFTPVFWNTIWTQNQAPHTLGLLCDTTHPALAEFPSDAHTGAQWWELLQGSRAFLLTQLNALEPIIQAVDDWNCARKLGLVFEAEVQGGRLLACSLDITRAPGERIVAKQLRHSLLRYLSECPRKPLTRLSWAELQNLLRDESP